MVFKTIEEIDEQFRLKERVVAKEYISQGKVQEWKGEFYDVYSPVRLKTKTGLERVKIGSFPIMDEKTVLAMLDEAYAAYDRGAGEWPCMSVEERIEYFDKFLAEMKKYRQECINILMWEIAKNLKDATAEFDRTMLYVQDSINELKKMERESVPQSVEGLIAQVKRSPLGVVFAMGPYNYPLNETFATIMPALMMGNTVVVKPPKTGSLIYNYVVKAAAGIFPKGVFSVIYGRGREIVEPLMKTGKVSVLGFIGAHGTANVISKAHPKPNRLKLVYGLDAKNLGIILPDADLDTTVAETLAGTLSYNGQRCTALKLLYVHKDIKKEFVRKYVEAVDNLKYGLPFDNANITPVIDDRLKYFRELVEDALSKGAKIANNPKEDIESFFSVKVLDNIKSNMRIFHEEQFGPIVPIVEFTDINEPIETILNSDFGQQCSVFGKDSKTIGHLVDFLVNQVSRVNINSQCQRGPDVLPFAGRKDSAVGTLSVADALKTFSIRTLVTLKQTDANKKLFREMAEKDSQFLKKELLF